MSTWLSLDPILSNKKDVINSTKEVYHNQAPKSHSFKLIDVQNISLENEFTRMRMKNDSNMTIENTMHLPCYTNRCFKQL